ncbi:IclR family transcriptional regulator [Desulfosarcina alkanivorans]|uniref:IclR family transcriptional regulator n=1 Tax=Desulfosarcina alkanivorans TaxID=571177 RepID=A0A5K7YMF6_9BACT|nr:IclR family transcriptional regulator [Desulfosarcina alkanivorans]BBO69430.1 IclR family transcriptional regulator [Desulfosarcina alkanivorans]
MPSKGEKYYFVSSLAKGLRILEQLASKGEMSVSQVAGHLGTSRAASHRFLSTLRDLGYVEKTEDGVFRLTFKVLELGMKKLDGFEIRRIVHPFMQEIARAFSETVNLGHWDGTAIVHLDKINSTEILRMDVGMGAMAPAYCTGLGKAVLAFLPDRELEAYLASVDWVAMSPRTITTPENLKSDIVQIRRRGYAIDDEELSLGLRCVAVPVFDHTGRPTYALSVSGPTLRMTEEKINTIQKTLLPMCRQISRQIGAPEK